MILQSYSYVGKFLQIDNGITKRLEGWEGKPDGYFQDHPVGTVLFCVTPLHFLTIGQETIDLNNINNVVYIDKGSTRTVQFIDSNATVIKELDYQAFWIDEIAFLEIAFELPEDADRDLLKYIANYINKKKNPDM